MLPMQSRRHFMTHVALSADRWADRRCRRAGCGRPARNRLQSACQRYPASASRPATWRRICCAPRGSPTSGTSMSAVGTRAPSCWRAASSTSRSTSWRPIVPQVDAGEPVSMLAGVHPGCFELFAADHIARVTDLKGKTVGVPFLGSAQHLFLASIAAYVGLDPSADIHWVTSIGAQADAALRRGQDRRLPRLPTRAAGAARARDRARRSSTAPWTGPGRNTTAACWPATARSSRPTPPPPSAWSAQSSRPPISAPASPSESRDAWSRADSPQATPTPCNPCRRSRTGDGATTTRRTPCGSTRCGSTRRVSSSPAPPGSSRTAPTGAS